MWAELHVASLVSDCPLEKAGCWQFACFSLLVCMNGGGQMNL